MLTVNEYCRKQFGEKLYKISLSGGMTCPNRDGTLDTRGCIFCSEGGSGEFAAKAGQPLEEQYDEAVRRIRSKFRGSRYIAYFQDFTNTYAPVERLRALYEPVIRRKETAVLSVATRPDCLPEEVLALLTEMNRIKPVWVELGLQTIHEKTVKYIRRGYPTGQYDAAVRALNAAGIHVITHVILGLPGETREDMLDTVRHVVRAGSGGIKLQLLHVLKGTDLAADYAEGKFQTLSLETYLELLEECLEILPEDMVVHRLTGDGPKSLLVAPLWSADKKRVLNRIRMLIKK